MRIIIYTGKGGVGKTSMAAATACRIAQSGKKVLIMSTDQAHSLGDAFEMKLGNEPCKITRNLFAMEIDTVYEGEKSWGKLKDYMKKLLTLKQDGGIEVEEMLVFPGLEELFSLFKILDEYEAAVYDTVIVDCAPTGETLSLLKYPEQLSEFLNKVIPFKRMGVKAVGPIVEKTMKIPMPGEDVFDEIEALTDRMVRLQRLMKNKEVVSLRVVTTPEKIVINEAKRNFTCLYLYDYNVDAVFVNRIYPSEAMEGYFGKWVTKQQEALQEIKECFSEVPCFYVELQKKDIRTLEVLEAFGTKIFGEVNPNEILFHHEIYHVDGENKCLSIYLPFADKEELILEQEGNELVVGVKNEIRRFPMPRIFMEKEIQGAKFEDGYLRIVMR